MSEPYSIPVEPYRQNLPDDAKIKFTHGDIHRSNILVTSTTPMKIASIVDWEQAGWLPDYWEVCKARFTVGQNDEWTITYIPLILDTFPRAEDAWDYYVSSMGP